MQVITTVKPNIFTESAVAMGVFDGVHIGHRVVIGNAVNFAQKSSMKSVVLTFEGVPRAVLLKKSVKQINTLEEKLALIEKLGVDAVVVLKFDETLEMVSASDYLQNYVINALGAKYISVGYNHHFGLKKQGTPDFLREKACVFGYQFNEVEPIQIDGVAVSSSVIRKFIQHGEIQRANEFLGRPFEIANTVIHGEKRGRLIGFPTLNLKVPDGIVAPKNGVYFGYANIDGLNHKAVINVGKRPTFADLEESLIEVHVLDYNGDLYGNTVRVGFLNRIRDEKKFDSIDELKIQISQDVLLARRCSVCGQLV